MYPLMVVGLLFLTVGRLEMSNLRIALDLVLVALGSLSVLAWFIDALGTSVLGEVDPQSSAGNVPYLVADAILIGLMLALANASGWGAWFSDNGWLFAAIALLAVSDLTYYLIDRSRATTMWSAQALLELAPPVLVVVCVWLRGRHWCSAQIRVERAGSVARGSGSILPLAAVAVALAVLLSISSDTVEPLIMFVAVMTVVVVILRLALAYRDSAALAVSRIAAHTDELTGLPNRAGLMTGPWAGPDLAAPSETDAGRGVLVVRIDRFDSVEDALGQGIGDQLLVEVTRRLRTVVGSPAVLARVLGPQFAVVVDNIAGSEVDTIAAAIADALAEQVTVAGLSMRLHVTVGTTWAGPGNTPLPELLRQADIAKNWATHRRLTISSFVSGMDDAAASLRMTADFERSLRAGSGLSMVFQPIVDLADGTAVSAEALLRWTDSTGRNVSPGEFIPLVNAAGLGQELDLWVIRHVIDQVAQWQRCGISVPVSVNVGADSIAPSLPLRIGQLLADCGVPADLLTVELLEDSTLGDVTDARAVLAELRRVGVKIAIDDFGTGWSVLSYLHTLDIDVVKIDQSFVLAMCDDMTARSIVGATVELARALGLVVVGEGVETVRDIELLRDLGCHRGQGFGLARPMPPDLFVTWWCTPAADVDRAVGTDGAHSEPRRMRSP